MADLKTNFLGLELKNPIIAGSSNLTGTIENIIKLENAGAGAVILKSIFEEQIIKESGHLSSSSPGHTEEFDYISQYTRQFNVQKYISLIREAKQSVKIPVIASINCISDGEWTDFSKKIESAGADALELNIFILPSDINREGNEIEKIYFRIIEKVLNTVEIPVSIKIGNYFSGLANMIYKLSHSGVSGIVLFNRFYSPDINPDKMEVVSSDIYSTPRENSLVLRWIGILSEDVKCDLISSTGIHSGIDVLKNILVGAKTVQVVSALYNNGIDHIERMISELNTWMDTNNKTSLDDIRGKLARGNVENPDIYEQVQFMKYFSD